MLVRRSVVCQLVVEAAPQRSTVMSAATAAAGGCLVSQSTSRKIKWGSRVWAIMGPLC
jgi:hypothetical protein